MVYPVCKHQRWSLQTGIHIKGKHYFRFSALLQHEPVVVTFNLPVDR